MGGFNRFYRSMCWVRRARDAMRTWVSDNPRRIGRMYARRTAYRSFAHLPHLVGLQWC